MVGNDHYVPLDLPSRDPGCIRQALALCWPMEAKNPFSPQTQDAGPANRGLFWAEQLLGLGLVADAGPQGPAWVPFICISRKTKQVMDRE